MARTETRIYVMDSPDRNVRNNNTDRSKDVTMMDYTEFLISTIETVSAFMGAFLFCTLILLFVVDVKTKTLDQYRIKYGWDNEIEQKNSKKAYEKRIAKLK